MQVFCTSINACSQHKITVDAFKLIHFEVKLGVSLFIMLV